MVCCGVCPVGCGSQRRPKNCQHPTQCFVWPLDGPCLATDDRILVTIATASQDKVCDCVLDAFGMTLLDGRLGRNIKTETVANHLDMKDFEINLPTSVFAINLGRNLAQDFRGTATNTCHLRFGHLVWTKRSKWGKNCV